MRCHWGYICDDCHAFRFLSGNVTYERPTLDPPQCSNCERTMVEVPVTEAPHRPRVVFLGIAFAAALVSALVASSFYALFGPAGDAEVGPVLGLLLVVLALPAFWGVAVLLTYSIWTINEGVGWLTKRPAFTTSPPWLESPSLRDEVFAEARLSLWFPAALVAIGVIMKLVATFQ